MPMILSDIHFNEIYDTMSQDLFESSQNPGDSSENENDKLRFHLSPPLYPESLIEV